MANNVWVAKQQLVAQVNTVTPANVNIGNTFTATINGIAVTFTATAATVANVTAGLVALLQAVTDGSFTELTFADGTTAITVTANTAGTPFTQTSSASGGTATLVTSTTTANKSPSDVNDALNWSAGTVPANGEDVYIDGTVQTSLLWNLSSLSAVALATLNVAQSFTGQIGLTYVNSTGTPYYEYRATSLAIQSSIVKIGYGVGSGSGLIKHNAGSATATTWTIYNTGSATETNQPAVSLLGTNAANILQNFGGSVGVAATGGSTSVVATVNCGPTGQGASQPQLLLGQGCTLTTITNDGGSLAINSAATTLNHKSGTTQVNGSGAYTTITVSSGTLTDTGTGTITTLNIGSGGSFSLGAVGPAVTITNVIQMYAGASYSDPAFRSPAAAGFKLNQCNTSDVSIQIGPNRTLVAT